MAFTEKILGQTNHNAIATVSVYSPGVGVTGIIKHISLCNVTNSAASYSLFLDDDGTTYGPSTALAYGVILAGNSFVFMNGYWPMSNSSGNFAYAPKTANAITITLSGAEVS